MNTRTLMIASAVLMGFMGFAALFLPHEILAYSGLVATPAPILFLQVWSGLLLAFAMVNWMSRANLMGGIYSRPVCVGNLMHFMVGGLALTKGTIDHPAWTTGTLAGFYVMFAVLFARVLFQNPVQEKSRTTG